MVDSGDPHSVSQLLCLLENLLDKHIEDRRYASSVTKDTVGVEGTDT